MKKRFFIIAILAFTFLMSSFVLAADLEILSMNSYVNSIGYLNVVGEIKNNSSNPYTYVEVIATFFDDNNNVVDTDTTYALLDTIMPGQKAPFKLSVQDRDEIKKYSLQVQGNIGGDKPRPLEIVSSSSFVNSIGYLTINGQVRNNGSQTYEFVEIIATFYDSAGEVVEVDSTYSSLDKIPPGGTSPFKIQVQNKTSINEYKLQAQ